ncbi:MAG: outer membrane protein assembly factor BamE [Gammaproteobacteria bacterium]|jgi:outer membrane protein assembly factor BamE
MKKLLIIITCIASLGATACSTHLVHKIDVQQGNVVTQAQVNQLEPGMTRNQVRFIMGSPMVADVFHQERWDYVYLNQPGYSKTTLKRVTVFFDADSLARIEGTLRPGDPVPEEEARSRQVSLVVPPEERVEPGALNKLWHWLTFRKIDEADYTTAEERGVRSEE